MSSVFNSLLFSDIITGSETAEETGAGFDGAIETFGDYAAASRKQINHYYANGTDISAILNSVIGGVIGSGVNIQARTGDEELNAAFELLLKKHAKSNNFDITGRAHRDEFLRGIIGYELLSGGVIIRHHYSTSWEIPYRLEMVGVDMIDTSKNDEEGRLLNGIQRDRYGRVTHIWLYSDYKKSRSVRYSMRNMTYYMVPWLSISQYTAVSRLVTILPTLDTILQYKDAEVQAALERAKAGVYWSTELYGTILQALNEEFQNANVTPAEKINEAKSLLERLSKRGVSAHGATPIPVDDKIYEVTNKSDSVYDTITTHSQKSVASAMGGSQLSVYKDVAIGNYASIKAAISFDEEQYKMDFDNLVNNFVNEYLERLFTVGVQTGALPISRNEYFSNSENYWKWDILRQSKRVIDEAKAAQARKSELESGSTTLVKEYGEKGLDYVSEMEKQMEADIKIAAMRAEKYAAAGIGEPTDEN